MASKSPLPSVKTKTVRRPAPEGMGNGLFAVEDIKAGEDVVHATVPFVAVLDSPRLDDTCAGCFGRKQLGTTGAELKACTGCRTVKYCDRACQSKDWKFAHSMECPIFQSLKPMVLPNNARALLRMVLRTDRNKYSSEELAVFSELETHIHDIEKVQAQLDRITLTAKAVSNYSKSEMSAEAMTGYAAKLDLNSFNLTTALYDRVGLYLHPYAALINHSCDYNATVGFDGEELFVKAIRPIKKDEQVFISYVDTTTPREVRCRELSERYYFDCKCAKCIKDLDAGVDKQFSEHKEALEIVERNALELMQSASADDTTPEEAIQNLEAAMHILHQTSSWPLTRQPYALLRDKLIVSLLSAGNFSRAFTHAAIRYLRVDPVIYDPGHPIRHIHAWILAKLAIFLSQTFQSDPADKVQIQEFGINFHFILWYILADLTSRQLESCTVPSFRRLVGANFAQVHNEFKANGIDPSTAKPLVSAEWSKLERLVQVALEKE